jgi:hypothetical protein
MTAVIDHGNAHGPVVLLRLGARSGKDAGDFGVTQYGFALHVLSS